MLTPSQLLDRLHAQVIVGDGAMGTVLQHHGVAQPYEHINVTHPDLVRDVHRQYLDAGANLIETNTFGANRVKLAAFALEDQVVAINRAGARLAREAANGKALVAGSIGPCGKALAPVGAIDPALAERAFREQAEALLAEDVDLILLETFNDIDELRVAYRVVRELADAAIIAQKIFIEDGETLSGGLPVRFAAEVSAWPGIVAIGANCAIGPQRMLDVVRAMASATGCAVTAFPTPGLPQRVGNQVRYAVTPEYFGRYARMLVEAGASVIGGCCGTSPEHTRAISASISGMSPASRHTAAAVDVARETTEEDDAPQTSDFRAALGTKYVATVELDVPRGLDFTKVVEGARALRDHGVDAINVSDGARARLRLNPVSVSHIIQEQAGIEVVMHFACRDRNLLAVQADLLGAHVLGIRNILAITGDPANIGDYPAATSVYDIDSVGLIRILRRFNEGIDMAGNSIGARTAFTIAAAFDPLATDMEREKDRLRRKIQEGAHAIYTQPIFERSALETAAEALAPFKIPLIFGLLPLRSARHCEFMHNEVPGISIPEPIRRRMGELSEGDARKYGVDVARSFLADARSITQGVYLMPPFGNHRIAAAVLEGLH